MFTIVRGGIASVGEYGANLFGVLVGRLVRIGF